MFSNACVTRLEISADVVGMVEMVQLGYKSVDLRQV